MSENKKTILIVEDDATILDLFSTGLQKKGFNVETAVNGEEGLKKILIGGIDLVLLDLMLPKMTGEEVLEELNKEKAVKKPPVIILSNKSDGMSLYNCRRNLGAVDYLIKVNVSFDDVLAKIKEVLAIKN